MKKQRKNKDINTEWEKDRYKFHIMIKLNILMLGYP